MSTSRAAVACVWVAAGALGVRADVSVAHLNWADLPSTVVDQSGASFTVTGLSGLTALADGRFAAVMDNSNRLVLFRPVFEPDGSLAAVSQVSGLTLSQSRDFEDVALLPGTQTALICDEGTVNPLSVVDLATGVVGSGPAVPAVYGNIRANYGFESVTVSLDGQTAWACNEEALTTDGGLSTSSAGSRVRLQRYQRVGAFMVPSGQFVYVTQPMHGVSIPNARSGVSALVALPDGGLLSLERSLAFNSSGLYLTRIYSVSTAGATDVTGVPSLPPPGLVVCGKTTRHAGNYYNLEGLALGPAVQGGEGIPSGRRVMLGVVDDGDNLGSNRVHAFALDGLIAACGAADLGSQGGAVGPDGLLNNNDFVAFIDRFFAADPSADMGRQGGDAPGDGLFDNNDFVVFIDRFFQGC